jgi:hypothetical protein
MSIRVLVKYNGVYDILSPRSDVGIPICSVTDVLDTVFKVYFVEFFRHTKRVYLSLCRLDGGKLVAVHPSDDIVVDARYVVTSPPPPPLPRTLPKSPSTFSVVPLARPGE